MIDYRTDRKIREFIGWLMAGFLLLMLLTSCYLPTPAADPREKVPQGTTPAPYWQLAAGDPWQFRPAVTGGRIGY